MIKLVKNKGQCYALEGKCKYLLHTNDFGGKDIYAKPGLKPVVGYILGKIKFRSKK